MTAIAKRAACRLSPSAAAVLCCALLAVVFGASKLRAQTPADKADALTLGARIDCLHNFNRSKGSSQDCVTVSGLRVGFNHQVDNQVRATLRLDPFTTPRSSRADTPYREHLP